MNKGLMLLVGIVLAAGSAHAQEVRKTPYWASIARGDALMRAGPERTYPVTWRYRRQDLPVQVLQVYNAWRRIREQDGTEGWMLAVQLSAQRTAMVTGEGPAPMYEEPSSSGTLGWRAEPGVVGKIRKCDSGWCLFDVGGKRGYISISRIWGVDAGETVE